MNSSRRRFLKSTGLGFLALGLPPAFLVRTAEAQQASKGKVMERGYPVQRPRLLHLETEHRHPGARLRRRPSH